MYEGVRRLPPLLTDTAERGDLRRVAMGEGGNSGKPVSRFPETWEIMSKRGYWKRTEVPLLASEYKGFGMKVETQRYINPYDMKPTRTGAEIQEEPAGGKYNFRERGSRQTRDYIAQESV